MNYALKILRLEDKRLDERKALYDRGKRRNLPFWANPVYYDEIGHQEIKAAIRLLTKPSRLDVFDSCIDVIPEDLRAGYGLYVNPKDMRDRDLKIDTYRGYPVIEHICVELGRVLFTKMMEKPEKLKK